MVPQVDYDHDHEFSSPSTGMSQTLANVKSFFFGTTLLNLQSICLLLAEPTSGSTQDAIKQLRSRRPMSRTEVSNCPLSGFFAQMSKCYR